MATNLALLEQIVMDTREKLDLSMLLSTPFVPFCQKGKIGSLPQSPIVRDATNVLQVAPKFLIINGIS